MECDIISLYRNIVVNSDSYTNQIVTGIEISSTKETEPMIVDGKYYRYYPKIRLEDIGTDTSNKFVDTMKISNLYLKGMGADFDGDTCSCKGVYTEEANAELEEFVNSVANFVNFGCAPTKISSGDVVMSTYALTKILDKSAITDDSKIQYA